MGDLMYMRELDELKKNINSLTRRLKETADKKREDIDANKILILVLSLVGALLIIAVVAFLVYRHFAADSLDDYDDIDDLLSDEDESKDDDEEPEVIIAHANDSE